MADLAALSESVISGDAQKVEELTKQALKEGLSALEILNNALVKAMDVVGEKYRSYEIYLPGLVVSARAMKAGLAILKPILTTSKDRLPVKIAIGTVQGDTHDIGKNIVAAMLEGAGFEVTDLGYDVPSERFVSAITDDGADLIGMSALVTTNMLSMKETMDAIVEAGVRDRVKIIIGGAPVTQEYANRIGADGYAEDAAVAVDLVRQLFKQQKTD